MFDEMIENIREDTIKMMLIMPKRVYEIQKRQEAIEAARKAGIPVAVCGEMASRVDSAMLLAGMGIRNLSMGPSQISLVKEKLASITIAELEAISDGKRR